jgi:hypothetical protein
VIEQVAVTMYRDRSTRAAYANGGETYTREYPPLRAQFVSDQIWELDEKFLVAAEFDALFGPREH